MVTLKAAAKPEAKSSTTKCDLMHRFFNLLTPEAAAKIHLKFNKLARVVHSQKFEKVTIGLYHTLDGTTNLKYKLLRFLTTIIFLQREEGASF